jgi:DNA-binding transcriptional MerR regulator
MEGPPVSDDDRLPVQARLRSSGISIGGLSRLTGVRPSAIRYYEACGLLAAPARRSGKRLYDREGVLRLQAILTARRLGFSISEIRRLAKADLHYWRKEAATKALALRAAAARLSADAAELADLSGCDCAAGGRCRLPAE